MQTCLRGLLIFAVCSVTEAVLFSSLNALNRFREQRRFVVSLAATEDKCGISPKAYDTYEFSHCYTCYRHVMNVKGVRKVDGEEEATDIGTVSNSWLHEGRPSTHFYDTEGDLVTELWSNPQLTSEGSRDVLVVADCNGQALWERPGTGYKNGKWGTLKVENITIGDADEGDDMDLLGRGYADIIEVGSDKKLFSVKSLALGNVEVTIFEDGKATFPEATEDGRIFVPLMGAFILGAQDNTPWAIASTWIIVIILGSCLACCCCLGFWFAGRSGYKSVD